MSVAEALKAKTLELRKNRDELAPALLAVSSSAQVNAKDRAIKAGAFASGNTAEFVVNEDDAMRAVQKAIKQVRDTISTIQTAGGTDSALYQRSVRELEVLEGLLPQMASEAEVTREVNMFLIAQDPATLNMKLMGKVMAHLQDVFGASLDKARASGIVKSALTS